jgi:hypothetical protein
MLRTFFPSMPSNEFAALKEAMGGVGWYTCANGHPFTGTNPNPARTMNQHCCHPTTPLPGPNQLLPYMDIIPKIEQVP